MKVDIDINDALDAWAQEFGGRNAWRRPTVDEITALVKKIVENCVSYSDIANVCMLANEEAGNVDSLFEALRERYPDRFGEEA